MRKINRAMLAIAAVSVAAVTLFSGNIFGYLRFRALCQSEGGLKVSENVRSGVGWAVADKYQTGAARIKGVAFVRYTDFGVAYDKRYVSGPTWSEKSFAVERADDSVPVVYELKHFSEPVQGELRTTRSGYVLHEVATGRLMLRWTQIGYRWFDQDRTVLGAPSGEACHFEGGFFEERNYTTYFK